DGRDRARNFARHKRLAASRTFVVKKNAVAGIQAVAFAIVHRRPVGKNFGNTVGTARPKGCLLRLRNYLRYVEHLAARCLVKTGADSSFANRFQNADGSDAGHIGGVFRNIEAYTNMALRAEMINFVRLQIIKQFHQINGVSQIAVMQKKSDDVNVRIDIEMIDARGVEGASPSNYSMHLVAFSQQEISQITSILAGDPGDQ